MSAVERIAKALSGLAHESMDMRDGCPSFRIAPEQVLAVMTALRDRAGFDTNVFVTAIDRYPDEPRFTLVWAFLSTTFNDRVRVYTRVPADAPRVASVTELWPGTAYSERECFDMFGIEFEGHAGLKRLLMPEDYDHFPLRKDFPHQGIEPDRLYRQWDQRRRERSPLRSESEA